MKKFKKYISDSTSKSKRIIAGILATNLMLANIPAFCVYGVDSVHIEGGHSNVTVDNTVNVNIVNQPVKVEVTNWPDYPKVELNIMGLKSLNNYKLANSDYKPDKIDYTHLQPNIVETYLYSNERSITSNYKLNYLIYNDVLHRDSYQQFEVDGVAVGIDKQMYLNPDEYFSKSDLVMACIKSYEGVIDSRPVMAYMKPTRTNAKNKEQYVTEDYATNYPNLNELGVDIGTSDVKLNYSNYGDYWVYINPNVYELYFEKAIEKNIIDTEDLLAENKYSEKISSLGNDSSDEVIGEYNSSLGTVYPFGYKAKSPISDRTRKKQSIKQSKELVKNEKEKYQYFSSLFGDSWKGNLAEAEEEAEESEEEVPKDGAGQTVFLVDCSGSMQNTIDSVINGFCSTIESYKGDTSQEFAFVFYNDNGSYGIYQQTDFMTADSYTKPSCTADGGGSHLGDKGTLSVVQSVANMFAENASSKKIINVADEAVPYASGDDCDSIAELAKEQGITIDCIGTSGTGSTTHEQIASATGGAFTALSSLSGEDIESEIEDAVSNAFSGMSISTSGTPFTFKLNKQQNFESEALTYYDALRIIVTTMRRYEKELTDTEVRIVNYKYGTRVVGDDDNIVCYLIAKGVIDWENTAETTNLYRPFTNEDAINLLYRLKNLDARKTFEFVQLTDNENSLADLGFVNSGVSVTNTNASPLNQLPMEITTSMGNDFVINIGTNSGSWSTTMSSADWYFCESGTNKNLGTYGKDYISRISNGQLIITCTPEFMKNIDSSSILNQSDLDSKPRYVTGFNGSGEYNVESIQNDVVKLVKIKSFSSQEEDVEEGEVKYNESITDTAGTSGTKTSTGTATGTTAATADKTAQSKFVKATEDSLVTTPYVNEENFQSLTGSNVGGITVTRFVTVYVDKSSAKDILVNVGNCNVKLVDLVESGIKDFSRVNKIIESITEETKDNKSVYAVKLKIPSKTENDAKIQAEATVIYMPEANQIVTGKVSVGSVVTNTIDNSNDIEEELVTYEASVTTTVVPSPSPSPTISPSTSTTYNANANNLTAIGTNQGTVNGQSNAQLNGITKTSTSISGEPVKEVLLADLEPFGIVALADKVLYNKDTNTYAILLDNCAIVGTELISCTTPSVKVKDNGLCYYNLNVILALINPANITVSNIGVEPNIYLHNNANSGMGIKEEPSTKKKTYYITESGSKYYSLNHLSDKTNIMLLNLSDDEYALLDWEYFMPSALFSRPFSYTGDASKYLFKKPDDGMGLIWDTGKLVSNNILNYYFDTSNVDYGLSGFLMPNITVISKDPDKTLTQVKSLIGLSDTLYNIYYGNTNETAVRSAFEGIDEATIDFLVSNSLVETKINVTTDNKFYMPPTGGLYTKDLTLFSETVWTNDGVSHTVFSETNKVFKLESGMMFKVIDNTDTTVRVACTREVDFSTVDPNSESKYDVIFTPVSNSSTNITAGSSNYNGWIYELDGSKFVFEGSEGIPVICKQNINLQFVQKDIPKRFMMNLAMSLIDRNSGVIQLSDIPEGATISMYGEQFTVMEGQAGGTTSKLLSPLYDNMNMLYFKDISDYVLLDKCKGYTLGSRQFIDYIASTEVASGNLLLERQLYNTSDGHKLYINDLESEANPTGQYIDSMRIEFQLQNDLMFMRLSDGTYILLENIDVDGAGYLKNASFIKKGDLNLDKFSKVIGDYLADVDLRLVNFNELKDKLLDVINKVRFAEGVGFIEMILLQLIGFAFMCSWFAVAFNQWGFLNAVALGIKELTGLDIVLFMSVGILDLNSDVYWIKLIVYNILLALLAGIIYSGVLVF